MRMLKECSAERSVGLSARRKKLASAALSLILAVFMVLSMAIIPQTRDGYRSYAAGFKDTSKHWAKTYINEAVNYGFVSGYTDGTFKPDNPITRAEFTKMLNAAIGNTAETDINFPDVTSGKWYYNDVRKGVAAGFISGKSNGNFDPDAKITRQETAVMLSRIVPTYGSKATLKVYSDYKDVEYWAETALEKITAKGYLGAYNDGKLHPRDNLTRGQAAKILTLVLQKETIDKNNKRIVAHEGSDIVLKDTIYANKMTIDATASDDLITFSNCVILGSLSVNGGKSGSDKGVALLNSRIASADINTSNEVRVYAKGESTILNTSVTNKATIENAGLTANGDFGKGFCNVKVGRAADIKLSGNFEKVEIPEEKADIALSSGTVKSLTITSAASKTTVALAAGAAVTAADVSGATTSFTGSGTIGTLNAHVNGITYEIKPTTINTDASVTVPPAYASGGNVTPNTDEIVITPTPANGASKVAVTDPIVLKFNSAVHAAGFSGTKLTDSQAETIISLRKNSSSGSSVDFTASVATDGKSVTITPDSSLSLNATYYLRIAAGELADDAGHENALFSSSFTTGLSTYDIAFEPASGSTEVSLTAAPAIKFGYPVKRYSGSGSLTDSYLQSDVLTVQKMGPGDTKKVNVSFTATMDSSNRQITVTIKDGLEEETTYYITVNAKTLASQTDGSAVSASTMNFTTTSSTLTNRIASSSDYDEASVSFKSLQRGAVYGIIFDQDSLKTYAPTAKQIKEHSYISSTSDKGHYDSISVSKNESSSLDFSNLETNTTYYIYYVLYDSSNTAGNVFCETVSTKQRQVSIDTLKAEITASGVSDGSADLLKFVNSSDSGTFYVGSEDTQLKITPTKSASKSQEVTYSFAFNSSASNIDVKRTDTYMTIDIPEAASSAGDTDLGTIVVEVKSSDKTYASRTYSIKLKRINQTVNNVTLTGYSLPVDTFTSSSDISSSSAYAVYLSSLSDSDNVKLTPNIKSSSAVQYKVDVLDSNTGSQVWSTTGTGSYSSSAPTLGTKKELLNRTSSKGYNVYRITTQYYIYGDSDSTGKLKSDVSYVKVKFVK